MRSRRRQSRDFGSASMRVQMRSRRCSTSARSAAAMSYCSIPSRVLDVHLAGSPEAPVVGAELGDARRVDRLAVGVGDLVVMQDRNDVAVV